jgi:hypothetical protein
VGQIKPRAARFFVLPSLSLFFLKKKEKQKKKEEPNYKPASSVHFKVQ